MKARKGGFTLVELLIVIMIIAILAGMMLLATGSATDSAEATKIINDLRNVKSAALMFYADEMVWPTSTTLVTSWEAYLDRTWDSARYGALPDVGVERADGKQFVGFSLATPPGSTNGVKKKLTAKASEAGLFGDAQGAAQYSGQASIYMNMK
jgi:general secretion pathway protein G